MGRAAVGTDYTTQDAGADIPPEAACIAVAGPVSQNKVVMTNRNWLVDGAEVCLCRMIGDRAKKGVVRLRKISTRSLLTSR